MPALVVLATPMNLHRGQFILISHEPWRVFEVFDEYTFEAIEVDQMHMFRSCGRVAYGRQAPV